MLKSLAQGKLNRSAVSWDGCHLKKPTWANTAAFRKSQSLKNDFKSLTGACEYVTDDDDESAALENIFGQAKQTWDLCSALMVLSI